MEIIFTAIGALRRREMKLSGQTSLWMFPIYGCASLIKPFMLLIRKTGTVTRGIIYAICIFTGEFISGTLLKRQNLCPWDYSNSRWNIKGLIRLDYFPFWFAAGLVFEHLLLNRRPHRKTT